MADNLDALASIAYQLINQTFGQSNEDLAQAEHPFDGRDMHTAIVTASKALFDDGYYPQATFEAFKQVETEVRKISKSRKIGRRLINHAFNTNAPKIRLVSALDETRQNEQKGFQDIFGGAFAAIRNPRAHRSELSEDIYECLDNLSLASFLMRKLDSAIDED